MNKQTKRRALQIQKRRRIKEEIERNKAVREVQEKLRKRADEICPMPKFGEKPEPLVEFLNKIKISGELNTIASSLDYTSMRANWSSIKKILGEDK